MNSNNTKKLEQLSNESVGRLLWRYSLPAVVGMLVMSLYNIIDRIFIGQGVGPEAIAGLAITFPVMNISAALGVLIGAGGSARISILLGAKDYHGARRVLGNALTLMTAIVVCYLTVFAIFIDDILTIFGASEVTLPYARDYMLYILPGLFMTNFSHTFNNFMRVSGYPVKAMVTMFIGAGVNVVLDPLFIFHFGWGIKGAAIATDISMAVSALFVMRHFFTSSSVLHFNRDPWMYRPDLRVIGSIVAIGAAPSLVNAAACFINVIINKTLYTHGGDIAVGAAGIFTSYTSLMTMVVVGLCQGHAAHHRLQLRCRTAVAPQAHLLAGRRSLDTHSDGGPVGRTHMPVVHSPGLHVRPHAHRPDREMSTHIAHSLYGGRISDHIHHTLSVARQSGGIGISIARTSGDISHPAAVAAARPLRARRCVDVVSDVRLPGHSRDGDNGLARTVASQPRCQRADSIQSLHRFFGIIAHNFLSLHPQNPSNYNYA